jgi:uncharacterized membrane protein
LSDTILLHKKRNHTADLLKGLAVIFMVQVHLMELFARQDIYDSLPGKISLFLGGPLCAPVFLAVMGYFLATSQKKLSHFFKRGFILFLAGILLNIGRTTNLFHYIYSGQSNADPLFYIFGVDILLLAGLSIIIIGLLQLIFHGNYFFYFLTAIAIACATPFLPALASGQTGLSYCNAFLWGTFEWAYFPLFPWLAYVLTGYAFYLFSKKIHLTTKLTPGIKLAVILPSVIISIITFAYASHISHTLNGADGYYHHGILFFAWMLIFMSGYILTASFIEDYAGRLPLVKLIKWIGKNVTAFYVFQWLIIGNIATSIYKTQDGIYLICWFAGVMVVSGCLAFFWEKLRCFFIHRKKIN